jgi:hypothetical protein
VWRLVSFIFETTGRFVAVILGLVFLAVGALLSASVVLACLGAPMMVLGFLLIVRGLF